MIFDDWAAQDFKQQRGWIDDYFDGPGADWSTGFGGVHDALRGGELPGFSGPTAGQPGVIAVSELDLGVGGLIGHTGLGDGASTPQAPFLVDDAPVGGGRSYSLRLLSDGFHSFDRLGL